MKFLAQAINEILQFCILEGGALKFKGVEQPLSIDTIFKKFIRVSFAPKYTI